MNMATLPTLATTEIKVAVPKSYQAGLSCIPGPLEACLDF